MSCLLAAEAYFWGMKISGFTFVKNAVKYDYPIVESIRSLLPLVDEMIVCAGDSTDETPGLLASINSSKIKIIHSVWDEHLREGGKVLAVETNKAKAAVAPNSDWLFYLQGDEMLHEKDYEKIRKTMQQYKDELYVEGFLFRYIHFYGSYNYVGDSRRWYNHEIRIIRNHPAILSWKDAQGFRKNGKKLKVKQVDADIYHYGWVKNPFLQLEKQKDFGRHWIKDDELLERHRELLKAWPEGFNYNTQVDSLKQFTGSHPAVMQERISRVDWNFDFDITKKRFSSKKDQFLYYFEKLTGKRLFTYKNYKLI